MLSIELLLGLLQAAFAEAVGVEADQVVGEDLELACQFTLLHLEAHGVDLTPQFLIDGVVLDGKVILDKLLHDLAQSELVDAAEGAEPADLLPDLLKDALPVDHLLEFVLDLSLLLHLDALVLHVLANFFQLRHDVAGELLLAKRLLQVAQVAVPHRTLRQLARPDHRSVFGASRASVIDVASRVRVLRRVHQSVTLEELAFGHPGRVLVRGVALLGHAAFGDGGRERWLRGPGRAVHLARRERHRRWREEGPG